MRIKEFRIVMPLTVDEYRIGQLFSTCELSKNTTGGGDGVQVLRDEPFENHPLIEKTKEYSQGQYTMKKYYMQNKVNALVRKLAPKGSLEFEEYSWNAYPYCRTVIKNESYMKDDFEVKVESFHAPDKGTQDNVHRLNEEQLKMREVVFIDITSKKIPHDSNTPPIAEFRSEKADRGPLGENWMGDQGIPHMCCYKLVTVNFHWWGLQGTVEKSILKNQKKLFSKFNRDVFLSIDRWFHMSIEDIRALEEQTKADLEKRRAESGVRGMKMDD